MWLRLEEVKSLRVRRIAIRGGIPARRTRSSSPCLADCKRKVEVYAELFRKIVKTLGKIINKTAYWMGFGEVRCGFTKVVQWLTLHFAFLHAELACKHAWSISSLEPDLLQGLASPLFFQM